MFISFDLVDHITKKKNVSFHFDVEVASMEDAYQQIFEMGQLHGEEPYRHQMTIENVTISD